MSVEEVKGENGDVGDDVTVKITLVWTEDNVVTMTAAKKESDWTTSIALSCMTDGTDVL